MAALFSRVEDILYEPCYKGQTIVVGNYPNGPVDKIQKVLAREKVTAPIFAELLVLESPNKSTDEDTESQSESCWHEVARWVKFEETVDEGGQRWSKPHISLLTFSSLLQTRNCFKKGVVLLDKEFQDFADLVGTLIDTWNAHHSPQLDASEIAAIEDALLCCKWHLVKGVLGGKFASTAESGTPETARSRAASIVGQLLSSGEGSKLLNLAGRESHAETEIAPTDEAVSADRSKKSDQKNIQGTSAGILKKLPAGAEVAAIFIGQIQLLTRPMCAFVRLNPPRVFEGISEVSLPVRFVFVLLVPKDHIESQDLEEVGRCLGTLMADEVTGFY